MRVRRVAVSHAPAGVDGAAYPVVQHPLFVPRLGTDSFKFRAPDPQTGSTPAVRKASKSDSNTGGNSLSKASGVSGKQLGNMEINSGSMSSSSESIDSSSGSNGSGRVSGIGRRPPPFRFLSTFKWEARKGWDVLLAAYLQEFTSKKRKNRLRKPDPSACIRKGSLASKLAGVNENVGKKALRDNVELYIITKPFMSGSNFKQQMLAWARTAVRKRHQRLVAATKEAERLAHEELANAHHSLVQFQAEAGDALSLTHANLQDLINT
eukprot:1159992-Pelagomonas_calceolata.AAC.3